MKIVRENINFERGENPRSVLGIGAGVDVNELLNAVVDSLDPGMKKAADFWIEEDEDTFWMYKTWAMNNSIQYYFNLGIDSQSGEYTIDVGSRQRTFDKKNNYRAPQRNGIFDSIRKGDLKDGVREIIEFIEKIISQS